MTIEEQLENTALPIQDIRDAVMKKLFNIFYERYPTSVLLSGVSTKETQLNTNTASEKMVHVEGLSMGVIGITNSVSKICKLIHEYLGPISCVFKNMHSINGEADRMWIVRWGCIVQDSFYHIYFLSEDENLQIKVKTNGYPAYVSVDWDTLCVFTVELTKINLDDSECARPILYYPVNTQNDVKKFIPQYFIGEQIDFSFCLHSFPRLNNSAGFLGSIRLAKRWIGNYFTDQKVKSQRINSKIYGEGSSLGIAYNLSNVSAVYILGNILYLALTVSQRPNDGVIVAVDYIRGEEIVVLRGIPNLIEMWILKEGVYSAEFSDTAVYDVNGSHSTEVKNDVTVTPEILGLKCSQNRNQFTNSDDSNDMVNHTRSSSTKNIHSMNYPSLEEHTQSCIFLCLSTSGILSIVTNGFLKNIAVDVRSATCEPLSGFFFWSDDSFIYTSRLSSQTEDERHWNLINVIKGDMKLSTKKYPIGNTSLIGKSVDKAEATSLLVGNFVYREELANTRSQNAYEYIGIENNQQSLFNGISFIVPNGMQYTISKPCVITQCKNFMRMSCYPEKGFISIYGWIPDRIIAVILELE